MVFDRLKKLTLKGRLEDKLAKRLPENVDLKHIINLHADASKVLGERLVDKFIKLYDDSTSEYSYKTPKNLMELRQTDSSLPYVFLDNIKQTNLTKKQILSGLEGLAEGFHQTDHKGSFSQEITSISADYMNKFKNTTYQVGLKIPYFFERLSSSDSVKLLETLEMLNEQVVSDFLENPTSIIDELKTEETLKYLIKYNETYTKLSDPSIEFKEFFLYNVLELRENTLKRKNVKLDNLFENVLLRFDEYLTSSNS